VEIPIALEILRRPEVTRLIDEFFFELHFRCEVLMPCAWGDKMPEEVGYLRCVLFRVGRGVCCGGNPSVLPLRALVLCCISVVCSGLAPL
jgi:hypothetical protein